MQPLRCIQLCIWLCSLTSCHSLGSKPSLPQVDQRTQPAATTSVPAGPRVIKLSAVESSRSKIKVEPIQERSLPKVLHLTGHIEPDFGKEVDVSSRINGKLINIFVKPGQQVKYGQLLALINSREISELQGELIEAHSKCQIANAHRERERQIYEEQRVRPKALMEAESKAEQAKVRRSLAEGEFKRQEGLYKEKIASTKDFLVAKAHLATTTLEYDQLAADLTREQKLYKNTALMKKDYQLADAEYTRDKQHFHTLEQHLQFMGMDKKSIAELVRTGKISGEVNIVAPASGVISHEEVAVGEIVTPNTSLFKITDLSAVVVSVDVPEVDLQFVKLGSKVKVRVSSYPDKVFFATISYISDHVRRETRTLAIRAKLDNSSQRFKLNMFAEIDLEGAARNVLACPRSAIQDLGSGKIVFVQTGDGFEVRPVTTGDDSDNYVEIKSGLQKNELVVIQGAEILKAELASSS